MNTLTVGIGEVKVSNDPESVLVTYALGSCIAVLVHDPVRRVGGMIHYMLPESSVKPEKSLQRPGMFADTGVPLLFETMYAQSCQRGNLIVKVAGGASIQDDNGFFAIGKRNYTILRKMFWKNGFAITAESVGGRVSRTVRLFVGNGLTTVRASDVNQEVAF